MSFDSREKKRAYLKEWRRRNQGKPVSLERYAKKQGYRTAARKTARGIVHAAKNVPCADCGVRYPYWVMHLDHVRGVKHFCMNTAVNNACSAERLRAEIAKCEAVCANCHAERTYRRNLSGQHRARTVDANTQLSMFTSLSIAGSVPHSPCANPLDGDNYSLPQDGEATPLPPAPDDHEAFLGRWEPIKRGGVPIARCKACGFECFAGADASIGDHDKACAPAPAVSRTRAVDFDLSEEE